MLRVCRDQFTMGQASVIANALAAGLWTLTLLFASVILCKYLIIRNQCSSWSMILFYVAVMISLAVRITYFLASCFTVQLSDSLYPISVVCAEASLCTGFTHSMDLIGMVRSLAATSVKSEAELRKH